MYQFNGPVTINNYNIAEDLSSSKSLIKKAFGKGTQIKDGIKVFENKIGIGAGFKGLAEVAMQNGTAYIKKTSNRFQAQSFSTAPHVAVSEDREIDRASTPRVPDDVGSIVSPLPATSDLFVTSPDSSRSILSTSETRRALQGELPAWQSDDSGIPQASTSQRSIMPPPLPMRIQRRPISPAPSTAFLISDVNGDAVTPPSVQQSELTNSYNDRNFLGGTTAPESLYTTPSLVPSPLRINKPPPPVPPKPLELANPSTHPLPPPPRSWSPMARLTLDGLDGHAEWLLQQPVQFPIMNPTQGPRPGSPDSMTATAPTPQRINVELNRHSQFGPIDTDLANVPPAERRINEFNSRSMMDLGRMGQVGNPASMKVLRGQYEQTYTRAPLQPRQERQSSDARARQKEKETQKFLREQR